MHFFITVREKKLMFLKEVDFVGYVSTKIKFTRARLAGSDDTMSASGSAGPGFDPRRGSKFSFENFQPRG